MQGAICWVWIKASQWSKENRRWALQLLPGDKSGLPSFLYPICFRINSFCFHFKAQLKYPPFSQKEGRRWRWRKLINVPVQTVIFLDIRGVTVGASTGAELERTMLSQIQSTQDSSTLYCSSREGHQATHWSWRCHGGKSNQLITQPRRKSYHCTQKDIHTKQVTQPQ